MQLFIRWLLLTCALLLVDFWVSSIAVSGVYAALFAVVLLSVVNTIIRPVFILLTLPVTIVTLGLFTFVINGVLFWFVSSLVKGFEVQGFWAAFVGAFLYSCLSVLIDMVLSKKRY